MIGEHPIEFVSQYFDNHPEISECEISVYTYIPRMQNCSREIYVIPTDQLRERFSIIRNDLGPDQDIAFHSRVYSYINGERVVFHLPLADLRGSMQKSTLDRIDWLMSIMYCRRSIICSSGRSYHLYCEKLLTDSEWTQFLAWMLVRNTQRSLSGFDTRWIGHRLQDGFSSLRWTCNQTHYLQEPRIHRVLHHRFASSATKYCIYPDIYA